MTDKVSRCSLSASVVPDGGLGWQRSCFLCSYYYFYLGLRKLRAAPDASRKPVGAIRDENASRKGRLHLLVPTTSSNSDLCKLLLSAQILGYPTPVLINFGDTENEDPYIQHLAKVDGIFNYLEKLAVSGDDGENLVLIVDGWDVTLMLRPDVLLKRYFAMNEAADDRAIATYGMQHFIEYGLRQTIIFSQDKICWPTDFSRPACWAVPETTLSPYAFGPQSGRGRDELSFPKWLNSGSIMGPANHLRDLFRATLDEIHANHTTDSDQFYLAELFGKQEYFRIARNETVLEKYRSADNDVKIVEPPNTWLQTEYHMGIDYTSSLFQTLAYWKHYLTWMRPVDSWRPPTSKNEPYNRPPLAKRYQFTLPKDFVASRPPFEDLAVESSSRALQWHDVELLYNTVTEQTPVLIHFTGEKRFRHIWWKRLWFQSQAEALRIGSVAKSTSRITAERIGGHIWHNAEPEEASELENGGRGGAWSDRGGWLSWKALCKAEEALIFEVPGDELYHPIAVSGAKPDEQGDTAE